MRLALGLETHAAEEQHGQTLAQVRRVLCLIAKDDRLQPEKLLIRGPAVEVDAKTRLDAAAAAGAARADADSLQRLVAPREIDGIVIVEEKVDVQRLQVAFVDRETDVVKDRVVEEDVRGMDHGGCETTARGSRAPTARMRMNARARFSSMPALPRFRLQQELQPDNPAPERAATRDRITIGVFKMFPDDIDLQLREAIQGPVRTHGDDAIARR